MNTFSLSTALVNTLTTGFFAKSPLAIYAVDACPLISWLRSRRLGLAEYRLRAVGWSSGHPSVEAGGKLAPNSCGCVSERKRLDGEAVHRRGGKLRQRSRFFFFQAEDGIRDLTVTGVQTCALPI